MSWAPFEIRVPGKWVLAGEHAVLRGATAVMLPHSEHALTLRFEPSRAARLDIEPAGAREVIEGLLAGALRDHPLPHGRLTIQSTIPVGAGLGSSAALCVALTRWLSVPLAIPASECVAFATRLEHRFHGQSSGMDVAAVAAAAPVSFARGGEAESLGLRTLPRFTLHDSGLRASTSECVRQVLTLGQERPDQAARADEQMGLASIEAIAGLRAYDQGDIRLGLRLLAQSMECAQESYEIWGLVPPEVGALRQRLSAQGALASKLTGAGGGGMVVAIWTT
jgi:mevalonate kinase